MRMKVLTTDRPTFQKSTLSGILRIEIAVVQGPLGVFSDPHELFPDPRDAFWYAIHTVPEPSSDLFCPGVTGPGPMFRVPEETVIETGS